MTNEVKKLIEKISSDEVLRKKFENVKSKKDIIEIANTNGFCISDNDFCAGSNDAISEMELEKISGGYGAQDKFKPGKLSHDTVPTVVAYMVCRSLGQTEIEALYN